MPSIVEIAAIIERRPVKLPGGRVVVVRALTDAESSHVEKCIPRPPVPLVKDPTKGSGAPPIPNELDPGHQAALREWLHKVQCAQIAIAAGLVTAEGKGYGGAGVNDGDAAAYFARCRAEIGVALTRFDLVTLWNALHNVAAGMLEEAEKNSSAPPGKAGVAESMDGSSLGIT